MFSKTYANADALRAGFLEYAKSFSQIAEPSEILEIIALFERHRGAMSLRDAVEDWLAAPATVGYAVSIEGLAPTGDCEAQPIAREEHGGAIGFSGPRVVAINRAA